MTEEEFYGRAKSSMDKPTPDKVPDYKLSNPKDNQGIKKVSLHVVPSQVIMEVGLAMLEGHLKYGSHNYRVVGVRSSVYYDAAMRHLMDWWEGVDIDPDSELSHITKAIATLVVLRDAMFNGKLTDDRPPRLDPSWVAELNKKAAALLVKYPNSKSAFTELEHGKAKSETVRVEDTGPTYTARLNDGPERGTQRTILAL